MSNEINTKIKEDIASDVCEMAREDIWNVIFAYWAMFRFATTIVHTTIMSISFSIWALLIKMTVSTSCEIAMWYL